MVLGTGLTIPVAFADEKKRLNIYDEDEPTKIEPQASEKKKEQPSPAPVNVKTFESLEQNMSVARKWLIKQIDFGKEKVDSSVEKYLNVERSLSSTVAGLKSEKEDLLPGGIYILISALSGSILTRNRGFLLRGATPLVLGIGAFGYFLPQTFQNTRNLVWKYEQRAPALASYHTQAQDQVNSFVKTVNNTVEDSKQGLETGVHKTRQFIADNTGLQINESEKNDQKKDK